MMLLELEDIQGFVHSVMHFQLAIICDEQVLLWSGFVVAAEDALHWYERSFVLVCTE